MFLKFLFLTLYASLSFGANNLESTYYIDSDDIRLSDIIKNPKVDAKLFSLDIGKHTKKISSKEIIKKIQNYGYKKYKESSRFIKFTKKSPINLEKLQEKVREFYKQKYKDIKIQKLLVSPRSYTKSLPKDYSIVFQSKSHLKNRGTFYIKTVDKKKLFFNYSILATLSVFESKSKVKRGDELSAFNCRKKSMVLNKFRAMPLQDISNNSFESKRQMKIGTIITQRDIRALSVVKRGDSVNVTLQNSGVTISFVAKAQTNGQINDIITVLKSDGKKLKVRVTAKHRAEIQ